MKNHEIEAAWTYHNGTKHSYESVRRNRHYLDWENQPRPFKIYSKLEPIALPQDLTSSGIPALHAISMPAPAPERQRAPTKRALAEIFFLSAGITKRRSYPGGEILFRAAACTGALYHIDLYLVCGDLNDLDAGVYHFSPHDFSLRRLRSGDYRRVLAEASGEEPAVAEASCVVIGASTFWRNAWKYQARAYRHAYWDNGTILANFIAAASARGIPAKVVLGFVDSAVSGLLALDSRREAPISLVTLGRSGARAAAPPPITPLALETAPLSKTEVEYPAMRAMHESSSLESTEEVKAWRAVGPEKAEHGREKAEEGRLFPLKPLGDGELPRGSLEDVIMRRGSTREFARETIAFGQLSTMLDRAGHAVEADFSGPAEEPLNDIYLIVHAVEGLPAGAYRLQREEKQLELLKAGDFRREAGHLGLGQEIPADCSVNVYFLADLNRLLARFGNRGYRAAQLEAAITGGRLYLAAYAHGLGASGLTFYDDDVTAFFSPRSAGKSVMFLIALGKSVKRRTGLAVV